MQSKRYFPLLLAALFLLRPHSFGQQGSLKVTEYREFVLTHLLTPAGPVPTALDANGVYPYNSYVETSARPVPKAYQFVTLENQFLKATICPDLGGKVYSIVHKPSGREVLYVPEVIRYTRILPRFYFIAGGIEISFPISHSPTQNELMLYQVDKTAGRIYVTCGERELRFGMQWSVEYSLGAEDVFLTTRAVFHNPGAATHPWMSWSNAALPAAGDTQFDFPKGEVLSHSSVIDSFDWERAGPRTEADIREMTGYFWKTKNVNAFGAFTPSIGTGLYHIANEKVSGIKLWSYGSGNDSAWSVLSTAKHQRYIEIQGGPIADQATKLEMKPAETRWHQEFWFPTDRPLDIQSLQLPQPALRPVQQIPLFSWARKAEVAVWQQLVGAVMGKNKLPQPPDPSLNLWPPSGMENLHAAFNHAIKNTSGITADLWTFYYGTWLAGTGDEAAAIHVLSRSKTGIAKALLARLLKRKGDVAGARKAYAAIEERWVQLHPQVVIERDKLLRSIGKSTIAEREQWLLTVAALPDEGLVERRVQLLIDQGDYQQAKELLFATPFQKVHQTYTRTALYKQLCEKLQLPCDPCRNNWVKTGWLRLVRTGNMNRKWKVKSQKLKVDKLIS